MAHVLNCLMPIDFGDVFTHSFSRWFAVLLRDEHLMTCLQHLLKQYPRPEPGAASQTHWALAESMLRHIMDHELDALETPDCKRAKVVQRLCTVIFAKVTEAYTEVRPPLPCTFALPRDLRFPPPACSPSFARTPVRPAAA